MSSKKASKERIAETARLFAASLLQSTNTDEETKVAAIAWKHAKTIENKISRELAKGDAALEDDSSDEKEEEKVEKKKGKKEEKVEKKKKPVDEDEDEEDDDDEE